MRKLFLIVLVIFSFSIVSASDTIAVDSVATITTLPVTLKRSFFIVPMGYYQPETNVALGISGGYYFPSNDIRHISSISYSAIGTFNKQFLISLSPKIYTKNKKYYFFSEISARHYPDYFFGIGNTKTSFKEPYTSTKIAVNFEPQRYISPSWLAGLKLSAQGEITDIKKISKERMNEIYSTYGRAGWQPYFLLGLGALISYNTRDNFFYPHKGMFFKASFTAFPKWSKDSYAVSVAEIDFRHYVRIWKEHVFAYQFFTDIVLGKEIPFQLYPTLGGRNELRGFREGMFKDNLRIMLQAEYRIPIYWRFKAAVFCSIGDVYSLENPRYNKIKITYGAGLRFRLNKQRVHLRIDYARNNYNEGAFYITATEAF